jgi:galactose mutarotase-like enzyme
MSGGSTVAAGKENVVIRAGDCAVTLLPEFGGKIASIRWRERELLQEPLLPVAPRTRTMTFDASDASGWDECLPSVAACTITTEGGIASIPDHGDLWREPWSVVTEQEAKPGSENRSVTLRGECFSLPLCLERTTTLTEIAGGWRLSLDYTLTNRGRIAVPWAWAAHALFAVEEGDSIELPDSIVELHVEGSGGGRLNRNDGPVAWPMAQLAKGGKTNLSRVHGASSNIGDKLFAGPLRTEENWCILHRPKAGIRIRITFDTKTAPYLGLWLCYGGWPEGSGAKQMCVAPEPSTTPVDSLAGAADWSRVLGPGESNSWPVRVDFEVM